MSSNNATRRESATETQENHHFLSPLAFFSPMSLHGNHSKHCSHCNYNKQLRTLDRMFDNLFDFNNKLMEPSMEPKHDFVEKDGNFEYEIPISHEMIENLKINEKNRMIYLNATKHTKENKKDEKNDYTYKSSSYSSWSQTLTLPKDAVENTTVASYQDGKLKLVAQKNI